MIKKLCLMFFILCLVGCTTPESVTVAKKEWNKALDLFQPIGKTQKEYSEWLRKKHTPIHSFPYKAGVILEEIETNRLFCSNWRIMLATELDSANKISNYLVTAQYLCI